MLPLVSSAEDYKIKYFFYPKDMTIKYGETNDTFTIIQNLHNETLYNVELKYQLPKGFVINQKIIEELEPNQRKSLRFNITPNVPNGVYNITIWAETSQTISGTKVSSPKYTFKVNVHGYVNATTTIQTNSTLKTTTINSTFTQFNKTTTTDVVKDQGKTTNKLFFIIPAIIVIILIGFVLFSR